MYPAFIQNIRPVELIFLLIVVLLLFGAKRLPELFRSFGKSIREFKKATSEIEDDVRSAMTVDDTPPKQPQTTANTPVQGEIEASSTIDSEKTGDTKTIG